MARLGDRVSLRVAALLMRKTGWKGELYCIAVSVIPVIRTVWRRRHSLGNEVIERTRRTIKAGPLWRQSYTDCWGRGGAGATCPGDVLVTILDTVGQTAT